MAQNTVDSDIMKPPPARRDPVTENVHGREIIDPYRWLENASDGKTQRFVEEQNAYTRSVLEKLSGKERLSGKEAQRNPELSGKERPLPGKEEQPGREKLRQRIEQLLTIGRV